MHLLRRKLEALSYTEKLDATSGALVERLVDDLVHTTESYRTLKMQAAKQAAETEACQSKVEVLKKDNARLLQENNSLHMGLIARSEHEDAVEKTSSLAQRKMEDEMAELLFFKSESVGKMKSLESENDALKKRAQSLLAAANETTKRAAGVDDMPAVTPARLALSHTLDAPTPARQTAFERAQRDLVQAADARVSALERNLSSSRESARKDRAALTLSTCSFCLSLPSHCPLNTHKPGIHVDPVGVRVAHEVVVPLLRVEFVFVELEVFLLGTLWKFECSR